MIVLNSYSCSNAKYFEKSKSVAFDQRVIEREIEKITERLDNQFEEWGKTEKSKTEKNE